MAALRNTALAVLRFDGQTKIAETLRFFASDPKLAVKLIQRQILKLNNPVLGEPVRLRERPYRDGGALVLGFGEIFPCYFFLDCILYL